MTDWQSPCCSVGSGSPLHLSGRPFPIRGDRLIEGLIEGDFASEGWSFDQGQEVHVPIIRLPISVCISGFRRDRKSPCQ
jgi:hypothetical protein